METELIRLLKLAQGDRSLNAFSRHADVSPGNLSRIMKGQKPSPEILKKLASKAYNNVTYEQLMIAAGYIDDETSSGSIDRDKTPNEANNKSLQDDLLELMIRHGIVENKSNINEKHIELIKYAIETYKNMQDKK